MLYVPQHASVATSSAVKQHSIPLRTAFIHLHSLISAKVYLPAPSILINCIQNLLVDVVVYYESCFEATGDLRPDQERLDICRMQLNGRLQNLIADMGEGLTEAMFWAWLHALLRSEQAWREDYRRGLAHEQAARLAQDEKSHQLLSRDNHFREEDLKALRRVILFTFEALQLVASAAAPVYAPQEDQSNLPPAYSESSQFCSDLPPSWQESSNPIDAASEMMRSRDVAIHPSSAISTQQDDFAKWLSLPTLKNLCVHHRLERRHWSFGQVQHPILSSCNGLL